MSTSQEGMHSPFNNEDEEQQADIQDRHRHQAETQEATEGNTGIPTRKILTPFSQKERQEAKLKLQAAMENSMELPLAETIAQLKVDVTQAVQDHEQAVQVQAAKERSLLAFINLAEEEERPALWDSMDDAMEPFDVNVTRTLEIVQRLNKTLTKLTGPSSTSTATTISTNLALSSASVDISQRTSMNPNLNNKNHSALAQLGHKIIPVFAGTEKIDFDRVHFKEATGISGPPTLNLEEQFKRTSRVDFEHQLVEEVMKFLRKYKDHYKGYLTDNFDEASWRFMHRALAPSQMDEVFTAQLKHVPEADRSFARVESIVWDIFRLSDLTGAVLQKLFTFKSEPNEGPGTFVFRVEALIQGAKAEEVPCRFLNDAIYRALPAQG